MGGAAGADARTIVTSVPRTPRFTGRLNVTVAVAELLNAPPIVAVSGATVVPTVGSRSRQ